MALPAKRGTATALMPYAKSIITMEEWETKAPLGDIELRSVNLIKAANDKIPLPSKVCYVAVNFKLDFLLIRREVQYG